jgi:prophage DNA circulation protein
MASDALRLVLLDASYEGVSFPVTEMPVEGGHAVAEHAAYGRDGVDVEHCGREAYRGSLTIPLLNGLKGYEGEDLYPGRFNELLDKFEKVPQGSLTHPLLGVLTVQIKSWKPAPDAAVRNGIALSVDWIEHNASVFRVTGTAGELPQDATQSVSAASEAADAEMAAVASDATPTAPVTATALATAEAPGARPSDITAAMRSVVQVVEANLALPSLRTVAAANAIAALDRLRSRAYEYRDSRLVGLRRANRIVIARTMALWEIALQTYGDARRTEELLAANPRIAIDPMFVPQGLSITVPPLT